MDKNLKKTKTRKNQKKPQKNTRGNMIQYNRTNTENSPDLNRKQKETDAKNEPKNYIAQYYKTELESVIH